MMTKKLTPVKITHAIITAVIIIVYFIFGNITSLEDLKIPDINQSSIVYVLIPVASFFMSKLLYKTQIKNISKTLKLEEKIPHYLKATIIRLSVLEGGAFLILFLKPDFILFGILIILYIILIKPSEQQFRNDYEYAAL